MDFLVTTLANQGIGSLRWAITSANSSVGFDSIGFDSSLVGGTISLLSSLPVITDRVAISGLFNETSAPGIAIYFNGRAGLVFRGSRAAESSLQGLSLNDAGGDGLRLDANGITVQNNFFGLMLDGVTGQGNSGNGIRITANSSQNTIGALRDPLTGQMVDNTFSNKFGGNGGSGILVQGTNTHTISGNKISAIGDGNRGILVTESRATTSPTNNLQILDNMITASGAQTAGIEVFVPNGYLDSLGLIGNKISTDGAFMSHGIRVLASGSGSIGSVQVNQNDISTSGPLSEGVYLSSLDGGTIRQATVNSNTILTTGDVGSGSDNQFDLESDAIYVNVLRSSSIQNVNIEGNEVTTFCNDADGIYLIAEVNGEVGQAMVSNNTISTLAGNPIQSSQSAEGIKILSYENSSINIALYSNTILQSEGDGILLRARAVVNGRESTGGSIFADLQGNNVVNPNSSGQIFATAYSFTNPDNAGRITLVGEDLDEIISNNSPADPAAFSVNGTILFTSSAPSAPVVITGIPTTITNGNEGMISSRFQDHSWVTKDGAVHVMANTNDRLSLYSSIDNGSTWEATVTLENSTASSRSDGVIVDDKLYSVYTIEGGGIALATLRYSEASVSWTIESTVIPPSPASLRVERPSIAVTGDGTIVVAFTATDRSTGRASLRVAQSDDQGATWTVLNQGIANTTNDGRMSGNVIALNEGFGLLYTNGATLNWTDYSESASPGGSLGVSETILIQGDSQNDPNGTHFSSLTDEDGNIHVVTNNGESRVVYLRYNNDTDSWDEPVVITDQPSGNYMQISLMDDGTIKIAYDINIDGEGVVAVSESTNGGDSWALVAVLAQDVDADPGNRRVETPAYAQDTLPVFQQVELANGSNSLVFYQVA
jgi:hypothetical protein